jgi:hypothetical protein
MSVRELHDKAMAFADDAIIAKRNGDSEYARQLFHQAYTCESGAASLLEPTADHEPTRSILYRSAAWLAFNAGDYHMANYLATEGLKGVVPNEIRLELNEVLEYSKVRLAM